MKNLELMIGVKYGIGMQRYTVHDNICLWLKKGCLKSRVGKFGNMNKKSGCGSKFRYPGESPKKTFEKRQVPNRTLDSQKS